MAGHVKLNRMDKRSQLRCLGDCKDLLSKGASVLFFPEGTRSKDGKMADFKKVRPACILLLCLIRMGIFHSAQNWGRFAGVFAVPQTLLVSREACAKTAYACDGALLACCALSMGKQSAQCQKGCLPYRAPSLWLPRQGCQLCQSH